MSTLYLHIGTPKTGTSMIQHLFYENRKICLKQGYCYPKMPFKLGGIGPHRNAYFMTYTCKNDGVRDLEKENLIRKRGYEKVICLLKKYPNVVMSDEHIWTGFSDIDSFWEEIFEVITKAGHELKVIVYLRRQDQFIQSYWAQLVKESRKISFRSYIEKKGYDKHLHYDVELAKIASVIGEENLLVRPYERGHLYKDSLLSDFFHTIGMQEPDGFVVTQQRINESLNAEYTEIKRILNQIPEFAVKDSEIVKYMFGVMNQEALKADCSRAADFLPGQRKEYMARFSEGNALVAKKYLGREQLFLDEIVDEEDGNVKMSKEDLVLACGKVMLHMQQENLTLKKILKKWLKRK